MTSSSSLDERGRVRAAEIVSSLCLATDLGMGFPFEHGFHATLMAARLADLLEVDRETKRYSYYFCLLDYVSCTADAYEGTEIFAGTQTKNFIPHLWGSRIDRARGAMRAMPPPDANAMVRLYEVARRIPRAVAEYKNHQRALCEVAERMSVRLGLPPDYAQMFHFLTDRWDGKGALKRASGEGMPLPIRISMVARDLAFQRLIGGEEHALETVTRRGGHAFDPDVVATLGAHARTVFDAGNPGGKAWEATLAAEPEPHLLLEDDEIDVALKVVADFSDLLTPSLAGHSSGVADLVELAARLAGFGDEDIIDMRRAAWIHDIGRVAVSPAIWEKEGVLTTDETEQVRLHPYHAERIFASSPFLAALSRVACCHHECLDGSGYHRGVTAQTLDARARLVAAADVFHALTEPRAYRKAFPVREAAEILVSMSNDGLLDPAMVRAVIEASGEPPPDVHYPAGLTEREVEVLGLLARGLQTKQIAKHFEVSPKTVDSHIQSAYRKIGVSTRAAATLFAMEHGLIVSGEFPIVRHSITS